MKLLKSKSAVERANRRRKIHRELGVGGKAESSPGGTRCEKRDRLRETFRKPAIKQRDREKEREREREKRAFHTRHVLPRVKDSRLKRSYFASSSGTSNDQYYDNSSRPQSVASRFISRHLGHPPSPSLSLIFVLPFATPRSSFGNIKVHESRIWAAIFEGAGVAFRLPGVTGVGVIPISTWEQREGWLGFCPGGKMLSLLCGG